MNDTNIKPTTHLMGAWANRLGQDVTLEWDEELHLTVRENGEVRRSNIKNVIQALRFIQQLTGEKFSVYLND